MKLATWGGPFTRSMLSVAMAAALVPVFPHAAAAVEGGEGAAAIEGRAGALSEAGGAEGESLADGLECSDGSQPVAEGADDGDAARAAGEAPRAAEEGPGWEMADAAAQADPNGMTLRGGGSPAGPSALDPMAEGDAAAGDGAQGAGPARDGASPESSEGAGASESSDAAAGNEAGDEAGGEAGEGALDPASLPDGTYAVSVSLRNASDLSQPSMAASAINAVDELSVEGGAYTLGLSVGTVQVGDITGHVRQIDRFDSFSVTGAALATEGEAVPTWTAKGEGDGGPAAFPVPESAKADGFAPIQLHSDEMPVSPQKAALFIDWSTLQRVSDAPTGFDSDASGAQAAPEDAGEAAAAAPAAESSAQAESQPAQAAGAFQVGRVYSVPIAFTKAGSSEASMAAQYFGGSALVRPLADGTFDVRFSTNRPDYVESVSYGGAPARITSEGGSSREFAIVMPRAEADVTLRLEFSIAPMRELGADGVSADMHLYLSRASDMGSDAGQVSSTASSASGASMPKTGDDRGRLAGALGIAACASAAAMALSACRMRRHEGSKLP